jgi:hypothetical protein
MMEECRDGRTEGWNDRRLAKWKNATTEEWGKIFQPIIPIFQYSNIPGLAMV